DPGGGRTGAGLAQVPWVPWVPRVSWVPRAARGGGPEALVPTGLGDGDDQRAFEGVDVDGAERVNDVITVGVGGIFGDRVAESDEGGDQGGRRRADQQDTQRVFLPSPRVTVARRQESQSRNGQPSYASSRMAQRLGQ